MFEAILAKLGFGSAGKQEAPPPAGHRTRGAIEHGQPASESAAAEAAPAAGAAAAATPTAAQAARPAPAASPATTTVDVMGQLEKLAAANPQTLNWRRSIVDLLKLLDIDSSYAARKALATELGCPAEKMEDSAQMNMWLHKTVLRKLADNGGNVPSELLH